MSVSAKTELERIFKDEFGPEWCTFNHGVNTQAIVVDRPDGQRIKADTLHRVFALIPEVLAEYGKLESDLLEERCNYRISSYTDED